MVIGFTERTQYVSENKLPGVFHFFVLVDVATLRVSEIKHGMLYQLISGGTATVVSFLDVVEENIDAYFSSEEGDLLEEKGILLPGEDRIDPLRTEIVNDFIPEDEECFTIQISPIDIPGHRELFMCDFVDVTTNPPTNYSCLHTICITDDDGKII